MEVAEVALPQQVLLVALVVTAAYTVAVEPLVGMVLQLLERLEAALKAAKVKRVVTAHRFIELGKFEALEAWLKERVEVVYLEDIREHLSLGDKLAAGLGSMFPSLVAAHPLPNSPAVILFTSGTEGEPKGVALSHANILANVEQVRAHVPFFETDIVFNPLPTFHSFGLTVGSFMPLYLGLKTVLHPTPRQPHEIVRRNRLCRRSGQSAWYHA